MGNKAAAAAKSEVMKGHKLGETRWQRQPKAKSGTETSLGDQAAAAAKSEVMKGDKLEKQDGSGSQERNHEGRQAWETRRQRQPRAK